MREIIFSLNNKIATISLNKASTKNSLNRNDLKQILTNKQIDISDIDSIKEKGSNWDEIVK